MRDLIEREPGRAIKGHIVGDEVHIRALLKSPVTAPEANSGPPPQENDTCTLVVHLYGGRGEYRCDTVREAIQRAIGTLSSGDAWPVQIRWAGQVLWELDESTDSREGLEQLRQQYG